MLQATNSTALNSGILVFIIIIFALLEPLQELLVVTKLQGSIAWNFGILNSDDTCMTMAGGLKSAWSGGIIRCNCKQDALEVTWKFYSRVAEFNAP